MFSEVTQEIDFGCRLCHYLSSHRLSRAATVDSVENDSSEPGVSSAASSDDHELPSSRAGASITQPSSHIRPSKAQRLNQNPVAIVGKRLEARRYLRTSAQEASNKLRQAVPACRNRLPTRTAFPAHNRNVIKTASVGLKPKKMPPPENGLENQSDEAADENLVEDGAVDESRISPHLVRVLRKQYNQHLQWMKSHGASESGFKKLERDYENLIESHTARVKQMRAEAVSQNRVTLLKAQKGEDLNDSSRYFAIESVTDTKIESRFVSRE